MKKHITLLFLSLFVTSSVFGMELVAKCRKAILNHLSVAIQQRFDVSRTLASAPQIIHTVPKINGSLIAETDNILAQLQKELKRYNITVSNISCFFYVASEPGKNEIAKHLKVKNFSPAQLAIIIQSMDGVKVALDVHVQKKNKKAKKSDTYAPVKARL